ncbi:MAG: oligosaccharide flippase family protein [Thermaerobacter sp.]|nr:oligosaccharide flippase family protein [Thermaerobacter sp.]
MRGLPKLMSGVTAWYVSGRMFANGLSYLAQWCLLLLGGRALYGEWTYTVVVGTLASVAVRSGLELVVVPLAVRGEYARQRLVMGSCALVGSLLATMLVFTGWAASAVFHNQVWVAASVVGAAVGLGDIGLALSRVRDLRFSALQVGLVRPSVLFLASAAVGEAAKISADQQVFMHGAVDWASAVSYGISYAPSVWYALRCAASATVEGIAHTVRSGRKVFVAQALTTVVGGCDRVLIGSIFGPQVLALYSIAARTAGLVGMPLSALVGLAGRSMASDVEENGRRPWEAAAMLSGLGGSVMVVAALGVWIALGGSVNGGAGVTSVLYILLAGQLINAASGPTGALLVTRGLEGRYLRIAMYGVCALGIGGAVAFLTGNVVVVPWVVLVNEIVGNGMVVVAVGKYSGSLLRLHAALIVLASVLVTGSVINLMPEWMIVIQCAGGVALLSLAGLRRVRSCVLDVARLQW